MRKWIAVASVLLSVSTSGRAGDYLYVWGIETRDPAHAMPEPITMGRDFIAVFYVRPNSADFGKLLAEDQIIRAKLMEKLKQASVPRIFIERAHPFVGNDHRLGSAAHRRPRHPSNISHVCYTVEHEEQGYCT